MVGQGSPRGPHSIQVMDVVLVASQELRMAPITEDNTQLGDKTEMIPARSDSKPPSEVWLPWHQKIILCKLPREEAINSPSQLSSTSPSQYSHPSTSATRNASPSSCVSLRSKLSKLSSSHDYT